MQHSLCTPRSGISHAQQCDAAVRSTILLLTIVAFLVCAGCGASPEPLPVAGESTAQASGSVTLNGQSVTAGAVSFYSLKTGVTGQASLDEQGQFKFAAPLPPDEYTVFLTGARGVPEKYLSETSSDYTVTLQQGDNQVTIDLK